MSTSTISGLLGSGAVTSTTTSESTSTTSALDSDAFMTLFLTQLKYQDPTNPLESYEVAAQLAQFSSVEKLTQAATLLQNIQSYSAAINNAGMASMVGKEVTARKSTVEVTADSVSGLEYTLASAADVTVTIQDSSGNVIYTENMGSQDAGSYSVGWDGKDTSGNRVSEGTYTCAVQATDSDGNTTTVQTTINGQITSCTLGDSPTYLLADGTKISVADVLQIAANN